MKKANKRILLTEEDFEKLTRGEVIEKKDHIEIALSDIGYFRMLDIIERNMDGHRTSNK